MLKIEQFNQQVVLPFMPNISLLSICLVLVLFFGSLISTNKRPKLLANVPIIGVDGKQNLAQARKQFVYDCKNMMLEGYLKTKGGFFYVPSPMGERLMIPAKYIEELKNASDENASFSASFREMLEGDYTTIGVRWDLHPRVVKGSLNANLGTVMPAVEDEIKHAFATLIPACEGWTELPMADKFKRIIAQASSRMMGGTALSRHEEWVDMSINFTTDCFISAQKLKRFPAFLRPIAQYFIPEMSKVRTHGAVARRVIIPMLAERERQKPKPVDLMQMLSDSAQGSDKSPEFLAYTALAVGFAAIHTSASVPTHLLYDLCAMPEYVQPLKEEIQAALAGEGSFTKHAFLKMPQLDSFMKESQRFNPLVFVTFGRVIYKDLRLSDGFVIPAHTTIGVPSHAITMDPKLYPEPGRFDGFRFTEQQHSGGSQFVTTNQASLSWGYGKHACSGRFFASYEIKVVIAYLLLNYDFKFPEGQTRPENLAFELQSAPNPSATVLLKKRAF